MCDSVIGRANVSCLSLRLCLRSGVKNSTTGVKKVSYHDFVYMIVCSESQRWVFLDNLFVISFVFGSGSGFEWVKSI